VVGVDIAAEMLDLARQADPRGDYRLLGSEGLAAFPPASFHLALAAFTFDNVPGAEEKRDLLAALGCLLAPGGVIVLLVSAPEIYTHEWASFTTRDFPQNRQARSGDRVRIVMTDVPDRRPVEDVLWSDQAYAASFAAAGLQMVEARRPLGREDEPYPWVTETRLAPWVVYVLRPGSREG
jgi:SAM-dependent methyltransferase